MPVTKTAKRALNVSRRKSLINKKVLSELDVAIRLAKKRKTEDSVRKAMSLSDRAAKNNIIHKNKSARIKSALSKLVSQTKSSKKAVLRKKAAKPKISRKKSS